MVGPKFTTLAEVKAAYGRGELKYPMVIDNDFTSIYNDDECVYEGEGPMLLLGEALDLLGIPHEPA